MRTLISILIVLSLSAVAEAGPLRRLGYRVTHPFAPIGSYSGPRGVFGRRGNASAGGCSAAACSVQK